MWSDADPEQEPPEAPEDERPRRLHPSTLFFSLLGYAKNLILPILVVLFLTSEDSWELWFGLFIVPAMILEAWRYWSYRYRFEAGELIITQGVLFKSERHIPLARIQNIDSSQGFLQRAFGVAEARVETASGAEAEAELKVLSNDMLEELRRRVFSGGRARSDTERPTPEDEPEVLFRVGARDLLLLGLDLGRGLAIIGVGLGLAWELDLFDRISLAQPLKRAVLRALARSMTEADHLLFVAWVAGLVLAVPALLFGLSLLATVVKLYGFRLERTKQGFRVHAGLFTHVATTVSKRRIQFLSIEEPPLLRLFERVAVKIETAGGKEEGEDEAATRQWLLPAERRGRVAAILREIEPRLDLSKVDWQPLAPGATLRRARRGTALALLASTVAMGPFGPWALTSALVLVPLALWSAREGVRRAGWARTEYGVLYRRGIFWRRIDMTFLGRIQVLSLRESPFDRRHGMASLAVDTAGAGKIGHRIAIPYLEREVAGALRRDLFQAAQRTPLVFG